MIIKLSNYFITEENESDPGNIDADQNVEPFLPANNGMPTRKKVVLGLLVVCAIAAIVLGSVFGTRAKKLVTEVGDPS